MSNYALIENGIVKNVIVADADFIASLPNASDYVEYTNAGIGDTYDAARDAFIAPKPFNSWVLDEATCQWQAPTPRPTTAGKFYYWSEADLSWRERQ